MIHKIYLNTIFYSHVEPSPTKTIYIKYYMQHTHAHTHTHTTMNSNMYDTDLYVQAHMLG